MAAITPKQQRFCEEYVIDLNGTQAAIRAGYSPAAAKEQAHRLLTKAHVQECLKGLQDQASERCAIDVDYVVRGLKREAEDLEAGSGSSRVSALEKLGKHIGMFKDRVEHSGEIGLKRIERVIVKS